MRTKGVIGFGVTEKEAQFSSMDGKMWTDQAGIDGGVLFMCLILKIQV